MNIQVGAGDVLSPQAVSELAFYRHKVFVERLGWQLQSEGGLEFDQFDRDDTLYVIARDDDGDVIGCGRLLPTTRPYLLGDIFPQLMGEHPIPRSPDVWELSRFAAMDFGSSNMSPLGQFSSPIAAGLLHAAMASAAQRGAKSLITVSPLGVERLLRKGGIAAHRIAPPVIVDGRPVFACLISLDAPHDRNKHEQ